MANINYDVPFVKNSDLDLHCFQASLSMIISYFKPELNFTVEELDIVTGHNPGSGTWPLQGIAYLRSHGIDATIITPFSYVDFAKDGVEYIRKEYGDEIAQWQDENNDLKSDMENIAKLLPTAKIEYRNPTFDDILSNLQKYPVMCSINSAITRGEDGYTGHFVVIRGFDENGLYLNDPGLPPRENCYVPNDIFQKAWDGFSSPQAKFLYPITSFS
jgi:hypothetical protein